MVLFMTLLIGQKMDGSVKNTEKHHSSRPLSFLVPSFLNCTFSEDDAAVQTFVDDSRHICEV